MQLFKCRSVFCYAIYDDGAEVVEASFFCSQSKGKCVFSCFGISAKHHYNSRQLLQSIHLNMIVKLNRLKNESQ